MPHMFDEGVIRVDWAKKVYVFAILTSHTDGVRRLYGSSEIEEAYMTAVTVEVKLAQARVAIARAVMQAFPLLGGAVVDTTPALPDGELPISFSVTVAIPLGQYEPKDSIGVMGDILPKVMVRPYEQADSPFVMANALTILRQHGVHGTLTSVNVPFTSAFAESLITGHCISIQEMVSNANAAMPVSKPDHAVSHTVESLAHLIQDLEEKVDHKSQSADDRMTVAAKAVDSAAVWIKIAVNAIRELQE